MRTSPGRRIVNAVMLSLSGICTLLVISVLFFILGYLLVHGVKSLDFDFFTKLPKPSGETGGGMANAIVGSGKVLLLATMHFEPDNGLVFCRYVLGDGGHFPIVAFARVSVFLCRNAIIELRRLFMTS